MSMMMVTMSTQVYRLDAYDGKGSLNGDPRVHTFKEQGISNRYYSVFSAGNFIYARSTSGVPFEVRIAILTINIDIYR